MSELLNIPLSAPRETFRYTLPAHIQKETGVATLTLVQLTAEEEIMATNRARNDQIRLAWELVKESVYAVNDQRTTSADGSIDKAWAGLHPRVRNLLMNAFNDLHNPTKEDAASFLGSRQVMTVGR